MSSKLYRDFNKIVSMKIINKPFYLNSLIQVMGLLNLLIFMSIIGLVDDVSSNEFHQSYLLINGENK